MRISQLREPEVPRQGILRGRGERRGAGAYRGEVAGAGGGIESQDARTCGFVTGSGSGPGDVPEAGGAKGASLPDLHQIDPARNACRDERRGPGLGTGKTSHDLPASVRLAVSDTAAQPLDQGRPAHGRGAMLGGW